jgi:hypothetical protein
MLSGNKKIYLLLGISGLLFGIGLLFSIRGRKKIVLFSESLVGQTEVGDNAGFTNEEFQALMEQVGWDPGDPWCVFFVKCMWYNMAPAFLKAKILNKISGSSIQTWQAVQGDSSFVLPDVPKSGDIAIWRYYEDGIAQNNGHAGIVKYLGFGNFTTVEGNTNTDGSSEGYVVAEKTRTFNYNNDNGLRLVGFIRIA